MKYIDPNCPEANGFFAMLEGRYPCDDPLFPPKKEVADTWVAEHAKWCPQCRRINALHAE